MLEISDGECSAGKESISTTVSIKHSKRSQAHLIYTHRSLAVSRRKEHKRRLSYRHIRVEASLGFPADLITEKTSRKDQKRGRMDSV